MKDKEHILNTVKQIITAEVEKAGYKVESVYLFGSRARADYKEDSDWDFFIVINRNISFKDEKAFNRKNKENYGGIKNKERHPNKFKK